MFSLEVGAVKSSPSLVDVAWDAIWLSLATNAAAATAACISSEDGGVPQVRAHPLPSLLPHVLHGGDDG